MSILQMQVSNNAVVEENTEGAVTEENKNDEMRILSNVIKNNVAPLLLKLEAYAMHRNDVLMS